MSLCLRKFRKLEKVPSSTIVLRCCEARSIDPIRAQSLSTQGWLSADRDSE
jgi:hypothetical protein